ncbi:MAG: hypothetical protein HS117_07545 [Verrucomicrobiaceae bacterium]|jgi:hypothetical protein|nr:hypothetical protein [Verrucomicrobiaceae bacterium]
MKAQPLRILSSDDFWACESRFQAAHQVREGHLSLSEQARNYDLFYCVLVRHLQAVGSVSDGLSDGDFSTSPHVDPSDVTVVVSDTETVFRSGAIDAVFAAICEAGTNHMVIFDTGSYVAVLPEGDVIGCSEFEDLLAWDQQRSA